MLVVPEKNDRAFLEDQEANGGGLVSRVERLKQLRETLGEDVIREQGVIMHQPAIFKISAQPQERADQHDCPAQNRAGQGFLKPGVARCFLRIWHG